MLRDQQKKAIETLIRKVGDEYLLPNFGNISDIDVSYKDSKFDLVTAVDRMAEKLLKEGLIDVLPGSLFIGEELFAEDKDVVSFLNDKEKPIWVVDPLDGTDNFVAGKSGYGIMLCLVFKEEILASWLYEVPQRRMTVYYAPDFLSEDGNDIAPNRKSGVAPYKGLIGKKLHRFPEIQKLKDSCQDVILEPLQEPSIICYHEMLLGRVDFLVFKVTYPWDHLPGIACLKSQGAIISRWSGEKFHLTDMHEGLVVAINDRVMQIVLEKVCKVLLESEDILGMKSF